jgi:hypothetical protein
MFLEVCRALYGKQTDDRVGEQSPRRLGQFDALR